MKVAIFPAGKDGKKLYSILRGQANVEVCSFVDNAPSEEKGMIMEGLSIPVITPNEVKLQMVEGNIDKVLVCSAKVLSHFLDDMLRQLKELNISDYYIVPSYIFRKEQWDETDFRNIFTKQDEFSQLQHVQFHISDCCNLNCRRCQHFSNIADNPRFPSFEKVKGDFQRLRELFCDINRIAILGGEPFLNPELYRYCVMLRELFPYSFIDIITNGLLVRNMNEKLISAIRDNDIIVNISFYPVLEPVKEQLTRFLKEQRVRYVFGTKIETFSKKMVLEGNENPEKQFYECRDRCCTMLRDGKLYPCYLPATVSIFNNHFGTKIEAGNSAIDIYDAGITGRQILERLRKSFDICRYCTYDETYPWEQTKCACMDDWIVCRQNSSGNCK